MVGTLRKPARQDLERILAEQTDRPVRHFAQWLAARMLADGRTIYAVAEAAGVPTNTLTRILKHPTAVPTERNVRRLAAFFGGDADVWAAELGYADPSASVPDPRGFETLQHWLRAALETRHETPFSASLRAGLSKNAVAEILRTGHAERPTLDTLAMYFGADLAELRAFLTLSPGRVAAGKAVARRLGHERMRVISATGRARAELMTPEARTAVGKIAGAASWRRKSPEERAAFSATGQAARRRNAQERGSFFVSEQSRAAALPKLRAAGRRGGQATLERYGLEHMSRAGTIAAAPKRNGRLVTCIFAEHCPAPAELIYQTPSMLARGRGVYHRPCYEQWRQSLPQREKSRALGHLGWIWSRVRTSDDEKLKQRTDEQMRVYIEHLRHPASRRGRPPKLLEHKDVAIAAAILHDEYGMTGREIGQLAGKPDSKIPGTDWDTPARVVWDWIRLGRVLLGTAD
jgi:transcriptional regulator with XRE-family HTH domain